MRVWVLGSGSRGNAILVESGPARVLIDAGFSPRALAARLAAIDVAPESIGAVVVTHEHADHASGAGASARKWGWTICATPGTRSQMPSWAASTVKTISTGSAFAWEQLEIQAVATAHDALEPVAIVVTSQVTGARAGVVYDLGTITGGVRRACRDVDVLVLEANHDEALLATSPYPLPVRARIGSRFGHLSNVAAARFARECAQPRLSELVLAHLSEVCNEPHRAISAVRAALTGSRFRGRLHAAPQDAAMGPFTPRLQRGGTVVQYELGL
jgi:phosphoribosyl 1,2-cyclic phosphodiesterase